MHNFNRNCISIDNNLISVGKGLHAKLRAFLNSEKANMKNAFLLYDAKAMTKPISLETLSSIWADAPKDSLAVKKDKKEKRDKAFKLYGSNRPFVNNHWEALKKANGGHVLRCPICGLTECSEMDHYIPRSLFPEYSSHASNLIPLCHDCNQDKHDYWLDHRGERLFFNAFFDKLPTKIIDCTITINRGFPQVKISLYGGLEKRNCDDAVIIRTIHKLKLLDKFQITANDFIRKEIQLLKSDYSIQKVVYNDNRKAFWKSRVDAYNEYVLHPESFNFMEMELYKAVASSLEMKDWVENSLEFVS